MFNYKKFKLLSEHNTWVLKAHEPSQKKNPSESKMVLLTRFWNCNRINQALRALSACFIGLIFQNRDTILGSETIFLIFFQVYGL